MRVEWRTKISLPLFTLPYFFFTVLLQRIDWNWWVFLGCLLMDGAINVSKKESE